MGHTSSRRFYELNAPADLYHPRLVHCPWRRVSGIALDVPLDVADAEGHHGCTGLRSCAERVVGVGAGESLSCRGASTSGRCTLLGIPWRLASRRIHPAAHATACRRGETNRIAT